MIANIPPWWGYIVGLLGVLFPFIVSLRRGKVDESALVLGEWRRLYDAHEKRIAGYEKKIESYERDMGQMRERLNVAEERILLLEQEIVGKDRTILNRDEEISGLRRQIGQITQSSAVVLGGNHASDDVSQAAIRAAEVRRRKRDGDRE